jgi:hypothetical protein
VRSCLSSRVLAVSFDASYNYGQIFNLWAPDYPELGGFPHLFVDGISISSFNPANKADSELNLSAPLSISGSVTANSVSGTVTSTSPDTLTNLTVRVYVCDPTTADHGVNIVHAYSKYVITTIDPYGNASFNVSVSHGSNIVIIGVFDSSRYCLNCKILN